MSDTLFRPQEMVAAELVAKRIISGMSMAPLQMIFVGLQVFLLGCVLSLEFEIVFRLFVYIAGEDSEYWSPAIMALTSGVMVLGFHLLAEKSPGNFAARVIDGIAEKLIPVYLIGVGVLIAAILYPDLQAIIENNTTIIFDQVPQQTEQGWFASWFESLSDTLIIGLFSVGIGALAVINVFCANALVHKIVTGSTEIYGRMTELKEAREAHKQIHRTQNAYARAVLEEKELDQFNRQYFSDVIAAEVITGVDKALQPHRVRQQNKTFDGPNRFTDTGHEPDPKVIAKAIKDIESISYEDIRDMLNQTNQGTK